MDGVLFYICLITVSTCSRVSSLGQSYVAAFSANLFDRAAENPMHFDVTIIDRGNHLDETTHTITVPNDGVYLGMISAGTSNGLNVDMHFQENGSYTFTSFRNVQSQHGRDTYARDALAWLRSGAIVRFVAFTESFSSPTGLFTSWGTASLPVTVGSSVAFTVARFTSFSPGKLTYPTVHFNLGNGWDASNNRFVAPRTGTYFFSYSIYLNAGVNINLKLKINTEERVNIYRMSTSHTGLDNAARSALLSLSEGDRVEIESIYPGYSNINNLTTFSGFLYEPPQNQKYAWAAYRTSVWVPDDFEVPYDLVEVNDGSIFENNRVTCVLSGVYYVYISAGLLANTPVELTLMKNTEPMGKLLRDDIVHNGVDTFGRSMLIECSAGDVLWVSAGPGTELYSDLSLQTSFCGFYVNP